MDDTGYDNSPAAEVSDTDELTEAPPEIAEDTQVEFEIQTDVQVQQAVDEISQVEGIQPEVWQNLEPNERLGVLQSIEDRMAAIQGRPPAALDAHEMDAGTFGGWNGESIAINSAHLASEMPVGEFVDTIVHEGRHAFQDHAIENPGVVSDANTVTAWQENRANYLGAEEYGQELYMAQPLEADAWSYANRISSGIGGRGQ